MTDWSLEQNLTPAQERKKRGLRGILEHLAFVGEEFGRRQREAPYLTDAEVQEACSRVGRESLSL